MTVKQYTEKQRKILLDRRTFTLPFQQAVINAVAKQGKRIFTDGKKTDGTNIGEYDDDTPLYINPKLSPKKFPVAGKPGAERNVNPRQTRYFSSYKEFRSTIGRGTDKVDLVLSGDMMLDFFNSQSTKGDKPPTATNPEKISDTKIIVRFKRGDNALKSLGHEKHYGVIFTKTKQEKEGFLKNLQFLVNQKLRA